MSKYQLIAFDMDGTLLNSQKKISPVTVRMIRAAVEKGKEVVFSTGRGVSEVSEYTEMLPEVRYLDCSSGALIYDCHEKKVIARKAIPVSDMKKLMEIAKKEDVMIHFLSTYSLMQRSYFEKMEMYHMGDYKPMQEKIAEKCEDIYSYYNSNPIPVEKLNLYHRTAESRERTKARVEEAGLDVDAVYSETTSLEINAKGVNKGKGLLWLCEHLGISPAETIAVGDSYNDLAILKVAGLSVAMGNAREAVKAVTDVVVADCDHDGCAEAIEKFLL